MKKMTLYFALFAAVMTVSSACRFASSGNNRVETTGTQEPNKNTNQQNSENLTSNQINSTNPPKADFTISSTKLHLEFLSANSKEDLKKYANKNIAMTGRILMVQIAKQSSEKSLVVMYGGVDDGPSCFFDENNLEQMKRLKEGNTATLQGFQDDSITPKISPSLDHCIVIEAK